MKWLTKIGGWFQMLEGYLFSEDEEPAGVRCPHCRSVMTCSNDDIEMNLEARVIIGDWRCENGHVQRIVGVIDVVDDDDD
jgi:hypothetical protein